MIHPNLIQPLAAERHRQLMADAARVRQIRHAESARRASAARIRVRAGQQQARQQPNRRFEGRLAARA
jgi:hypothetical protein